MYGGLQKARNVIASVPLSIEMIDDPRSAKPFAGPALAIALAKEAERLVAVHLTDPAFRAGIASGRFDGLDPRAQLVARYVLFVTAGLAHSAADMHDPVEAFLGELVSSVLGDVGGRLPLSAVERGAWSADEGVRERLSRGEGLAAVVEACRREASTVEAHLETANRWVSRLRASRRHR